jgi:YVTN family beta-propeller protein
MKIFRVWWSGLSGGAALLAALALTVFAVGCGDVFRPVAIPITGPPGDPQPTSFAFVISQNAPGDAGSALQLNVPGDSAAFSTPAGLDPVFAAFLPPGESRIFVANRDDDTVSTYVPSLTSETPITLNLAAGSRPVFLATTETGKMYVANAGNNSVGVINGLQAALTTTVTVGSTPVALAETPDRKKLYSANQGDGTVSVIDTATNSVLQTISLPPGAAPIWALFSPNGQELYVLNQGLGTVSVINAISDTIVATLPVGTSPVHMFVDKQFNRLYVVDSASSNNLWIFDASVDPPKPLKTLTVQPDPLATVLPLPTSVTVLPNGQKAYVASIQPNTPTSGQVKIWVSVINATSITVQGKLSFPQSAAICNPNNAPFTQPGGVRFPAFVASSSNSNRVYISSCDAGVIHILNATNDSLVTDIASPPSSFPPPTNTSPPPPQQPVFVLPGP